MMAVNTKTFLVGSLTINAITLGVLIFLLNSLLSLPDTTPAQVRLIFVTNAPPAMVQKSTNAETPHSP
jgi:hypothetical protein